MRSSSCSCLALRTSFRLAVRVPRRSKPSDIREANSDCVVEPGCRQASDRLRPNRASARCRAIRPAPMIESTSASSTCCSRLFTNDMLGIIAGELKTIEGGLPSPVGRFRLTLACSSLPPVQDPRFELYFRTSELRAPESAERRDVMLVVRSVPTSHVSDLEVITLWQFWGWHLLWRN